MSEAVSSASRGSGSSGYLCVNVGFFFKFLILVQAGNAASLMRCPVIIKN